MQGALSCQCLLACPALLTLNPLPHRSRSGDQAGHLVLGTLPPFTILDSNFLAMEGASLAQRDSGLPQVRTKTQAQHTAAASLGSRISSIRCVVESTLQCTMPNILLQVKDPPPPSPASWPADPQESIIPVLLPRPLTLRFMISIQSHLWRSLSPTGPLTTHMLILLSVNWW